MNRDPEHVTKHLVFRDRMQLAPGDLIWVPQNQQWQRILHLEMNKLSGLWAYFANTEPVVLSHQQYQVVVTGVVQEEA